MLMIAVFWWNRMLKYRRFHLFRNIICRGMNCVVKQSADDTSQQQRLSAILIRKRRQSREHCQYVCILWSKRALLLADENWFWQQTSVFRQTSFAERPERLYLGRRQWDITDLSAAPCWTCRKWVPVECVRATWVQMNERQSVKCLPRMY